MNDDELLDEVDRNDTVIGHKYRSQLNSQDRNYRAINVFLRNSQGQIWIPRRAEHKRAFPLCLDLSCGGYVKSGESYEQALEREVEEELALTIDLASCRLLGYLTPYIDDVSMFMKVWEIQTDKTPDWNPTDFSEALWIDPAEILRRIQQGERVKDDLPRLITRFYCK